MVFAFCQMFLQFDYVTVFKVLWILILIRIRIHTGKYRINNRGRGGRSRRGGQHNFLANISVVDPDPNWIRIQDLCGSGSVFRIRIRIHTGNIG